MASLEMVMAKAGLVEDHTIDQDIDRGRSLPTSFYFDPEMLELERDRIFDRTWQYICHVDQVRNVGDHAVAQLGRTPVIVIRGADGLLRGFVNACRHRLHPLATGNGNSRVLICPYHAWSYELDGRLKAAPGSANESSFDCGSASLLPIAIETWGPWVFGNPDAAARPLHELTASISEPVESLNADLAKYEFRQRYTYSVACNWKIWIENAIECYHCPALHRTTFAKAYALRVGEYRSTSTLDTMYYTAPIRWAPPGVDPATLSGMRFVFLYPNCFFSVDEYVGFISTVVPTGPETCEAIVDVYANPSADVSMTEQWMAMLDETLAEDVQATELVQLGYRSGRIPNARFMLASEDSLQAFARRTWLGLSREDP